MSDLSYEIIANYMRGQFHPEQVTVTVGKRTDTTQEGYRILLTENETGKQKEFLTGPSTTVSHLEDMAVTAARLFGYEWSDDVYAGEPV